MMVKMYETLNQLAHGRKDLSPHDALVLLII